MIHYFDTDEEINKSFEAWKKRYAATAADPVREAYIAGIWEGCRNYILMPRDECQRRAEHYKEVTQHTQLV